MTNFIDLLPRHVKLFFLFISETSAFAKENEDEEKADEGDDPKEPEGAMDAHRPRQLVLESHR